MQDDGQATTPPERCTLQHAVFTSFGEPLFRRSEADATPSMVVQLGDREALLSLRSLQREFGIADESADGRMLGLIAEALNFVHTLKLGDRLPDEVLTGQASWQPDPAHIHIAATRLKLGLVAWLQGEWPAAPPLTQTHCRRSPATRLFAARSKRRLAVPHQSSDSETLRKR